ncbi:MAG TPA: hypothetical protein VJL09_00665 [Candidatus Paceibacterota bacterium]
MFDANVFKHVVEGSPALRTAICENEPLYFAAYYFPEYFTFPIAPFHYDLYDDIKDLSSGDLSEAMWCVFRYGAKTSLAKIALLAWMICYKKRRYLNWDSYDSDNAEAALFDVTVALQTNPRIIADFGNLYFKKKTREALSEAKMKRVKNFITENGVRVAAFSTQESTRGRLFENIRPDGYCLDDFENSKTKDSPVITQKIIDHIEEMRSGLEPGAFVLYLCNYLTDTGSVAYLMENLKKSARAVVRFIPVTDPNGKIAWPGRFVHTKAEAFQINRDIDDIKLHVVSLEERKEALPNYETELMLNPSKAGDLFFDRRKVEEAIKKALPAAEENAGFMIWEKFNPRHAYSMGADTAEGIGADSNASAVIDLTRTPNLVAATFEDNEMSNTTFGWELKRQGLIFGLPFLVCEINMTGYGTIAELITAEYPHLYRREVKNKQTNKISKEYGWRATVGTKSQVLGEFKEAFESGELEILDAGLLEEMKLMRKNDARIATRQKGATRHFDKVRAAALAWEGRGHALTPAAAEEAARSVRGNREERRESAQDAGL